MARHGRLSIRGVGLHKYGSGVGEVKTWGECGRQDMDLLKQGWACSRQKEHLSNISDW